MAADHTTLSLPQHDAPAVPLKPWQQQQQQQWPEIPVAQKPAPAGYVGATLPDAPAIQLQQQWQQQQEWQQQQLWQQHQQQQQWKQQAQAQAHGATPAPTWTKSCGPNSLLHDLLNDVVKKSLTAKPKNEPISPPQPPPQQSAAGGNHDEDTSSPTGALNGSPGQHGNDQDAAGEEEGGHPEDEWDGEGGEDVDGLFTQVLTLKERLQNLDSENNQLKHQLHSQRALMQQMEVALLNQEDGEEEGQQGPAAAAPGRGRQPALSPREPAASAAPTVQLPPASALAPPAADTPLPPSWQAAAGNGNGSFRAAAPYQPEPTPAWQQAAQQVPQHYYPAPPYYAPPNPYPHQVPAYAQPVPPAAAPYLQQHPAQQAYPPPAYLHPGAQYHSPPYPHPQPHYPPPVAPAPQVRSLGPDPHAAQLSPPPKPQQQPSAAPAHSPAAAPLKGQSPAKAHAAQSWACQVCTYEHSGKEALFLRCGVCNALR